MQGRKSLHWLSFPAMHRPDQPYVNASLLDVYLREGSDRIWHAYDRSLWAAIVPPSRVLSSHTYGMQRLHEVCRLNDVCLCLLPWPSPCLSAAHEVV
jgi:hypothetical protein